MAYSELVKNFEKVRAYMRDFYVYGFKSRQAYDRKSARSYDDERRRIESWLGDHMRFVRTSEGKNVFLSVDSRSVSENPFYRAWKTKSFTDGDITLHFLLLDLLPSPAVKRTLAELLAGVDAMLSELPSPMTFDESTVRKKLREYETEGLIRTEKEGRQVYYSRMPQPDLSSLSDVLDFFSEVAPCGVIGSFAEDRIEAHARPFFFKHHYMTGALDSEVMAALFDAMQKKCAVTVKNHGRIGGEKHLHLIPLKIYISVQNGRNHLIAHLPESNRLCSYRLDYLSDVCLGEVCDRYDAMRAELARGERFMWGVNCRWNTRHLEHVTMDVYVSPEETHILRRLEREKRCGTVEVLDAFHYRYTADVINAQEMLPWIRTLIGRITAFSCSNAEVERTFYEDLQTMYRLYGIEGGDDCDIQ